MERLILSAGARLKACSFGLFMLRYYYYIYKDPPFFVYLQVGNPTKGFFCFCVRARAFIYISRDLPTDTDPSFPLFLTHEER